MTASYKAGKLNAKLKARGTTLVQLASKISDSLQCEFDPQDRKCPCLDITWMVYLEILDELKQKLLIEVTFNGGPENDWEKGYLKGFSDAIKRLKEDTLMNLVTKADEEITLIRKVK